MCAAAAAAAAAVRDGEKQRSKEPSDDVDAPQPQPVGVMSLYCRSVILDYAVETMIRVVCCAGRAVLARRPARCLFFLSHTRLSPLCQPSPAHKTNNRPTTNTRNVLLLFI